ASRRRRTPRRPRSHVPRSGAVDDASAAAARQVAERPPQQNEHAVLEADEVGDVHAEPEGPGEEAAHRNAAHDPDGARPADRRELSLVAVAERLTPPRADRA